MAIRGTDFVLNPEKMDKEYMLVEVSEWTDFDTKQILGSSYIVLVPKLQFEKIRVNVKSAAPIVTKEDLAAQGQIPITFEGLRTWASVYNGRLSVKAEAAGAAIAPTKSNKPPEVK